MRRRRKNPSSPTRPGASRYASRRLPRTLPLIHSHLETHEAGRFAPFGQYLPRVGSYPYTAPVYRHRPPQVARIDSFPKPVTGHNNRRTNNDLRSLFFRAPSRVALCVKRKIRREVLFGKSIAGRRGGSPGPYRRSPESAYSCR